jgi:30S ribosomal protein S31
MGKGDKKTRRGKIFMGSYGKLRPKTQQKKPLQASANPMPKEQLLDKKTKK